MPRYYLSLNSFTIGPYKTSRAKSPKEYIFVDSHWRMTAPCYTVYLLERSVEVLKDGVLLKIVRLSTAQMNTLRNNIIHSVTNALTQ